MPPARFEPRSYLTRVLRRLADPALFTPFQSSVLNSSLRAARSSAYFKDLFSLYVFGLFAFSFLGLGLFGIDGRLVTLALGCVIWMGSAARKYDLFALICKTDSVRLGTDIPKGPELLSVNLG
jgi:hypothetical protein